MLLLCETMKCNSLGVSIARTLSNGTSVSVERGVRGIVAVGETVRCVGAAYILIMNHEYLGARKSLSWLGIRPAHTHTHAQIQWAETSEFFLQ